MHVGNSGAGTSFNLGTKAGEEKHVLIQQEIPAHTHTVRASSTDADAPVPAGFVLARSVNEIYKDPTGLAPMRSGTLANAGSSEGHENMQPYLVLNYCIALQGLFPSRN